jgi:hypothetical protein
MTNSSLLLLEGIVSDATSVHLYGLRRFIADGDRVWDCLFHVSPPRPLASLPLERFLVVPLATADFEDASNRAASAHIRRSELTLFGWLDSSSNQPPDRSIAFFTLALEGEEVVIGRVERVALITREAIAISCGTEALYTIDESTAAIFESATARKESWSRLDGEP